MKTIGLINLPSPFLIDQRTFPPLGILCLAAYLRRHGIDVDVIDLTCREDDLEEALRDCDYKIAGISAATPQYHLAKRVKDIFKRRNPATLAVIGGSHASSVPERCLADGFDCVVCGEGEEALRRIVAETLAGRPPKGIVQEPYISDIDTLPYPARDMIDLAGYGYDVGQGKATTLMTSRGCPHHCAFCSKDVWRHCRLHGVEYVIEEIRTIREDHGFKHLLFLDDSFTINAKRLRAVCERISDWGLQWRCYSRVDSLKPDMLAVMKKAGCTEIGIGVESGSQRILDTMRKGVRVEDNSRFVKQCQEAGIDVNCFIMIGLPGETYETVEETRRWMEAARPDKFGFNIFVPYAGTHVYNHIGEYDLRILPMPDEHSWVKGKPGEYRAYVETKALSAAEILRLFNELFAYYTELTSWQPGVGQKRS